MGQYLSILMRCVILTHTLVTTGGGRLYLQIRYLRELKGLSLVDVSERSGVTVAALSRLERGLSKPRPSTLRKIAQALNVSVEELWTPDEGKLAA